MVRTKNKNAKSSARMHTSRMRVKSSRRAKSESNSRKTFIFSRRAILTVIVMSMLIVILAVLFNVFSDPKLVVKRKTESIAVDYYENYYYDTIIGANSNDLNNKAKTLEDIMSRYTKNGFTPIPLKQLLLFDGQRHASDSAILTKYCDENSTTIHIYPQPPFGKKDYRIEYNYACGF